MPSVWDDTPIVELPIYRPACPHCGSASYSHVYTKASGDGATFERVKCNDCGERYRVLREPPLPFSGKAEWPDPYDAEG